MSRVKLLRSVMVLIALTVAPAAAETLRVATYGADLSRAGPGVLLHELGREPEAELATAVRVIQAVRPDVLLLTRFDHDLRGRALEAFLELLRQGAEGIDYPHVFAAPVNAGVPIGFDMDDDGRLAGWDDNLGFGKFPGHGGMALVSRLPIDAEAARTFRTLLWRDLPGARLPEREDGTPYPSAEAQAVMRLSSRSHWDVPVVLEDGGRLHLLASAPTPPLFDGPEKMNARRNADEIGFWLHYLDGEPLRDDLGHKAAAPDAPLVVLGDLQLDPKDGAGQHDAVAGLLAHTALQDPEPSSAGAAAAARAQGGANRDQQGRATLDTADWRDEGGPGNLRVDYVLPSAGLEVAEAGVFWPAPGAPLAEPVAEGSPHRLVWVDLVLR